MIPTLPTMSLINLPISRERLRQGDRHVPAVSPSLMDSYSEPLRHSTYVVPAPVKEVRLPLFTYGMRQTIRVRF